MRALYNTVSGPPATTSRHVSLSGFNSHKKHAGFSSTQRCQVLLFCSILFFFFDENTSKYCRI